MDHFVTRVIATEKKRINKLGVLRLADRQHLSELSDEAENLPPASRPARFVDCLGVPISACSRRSAVDLVLEHARARRSAAVHLCNAFVLASASRERDYTALLGRGALNLADGAPVAWAIRRGGVAGAERIRGVDLMLAVADAGRSEGLRHYLLGGTPATVATLAKALEHRFPGIRIAGVESPPFRSLGEDERAEQAQRVAASGAQVVWVGLGTPKQDYAVEDLVSRVPVVAVAVGAAFDFIAGLKPQAPPWMQTSGLEWVHRLGCEPRRLWRRYLFGNARFVYELVRTPARVLVVPSG